METNVYTNGPVSVTVGFIPPATAFIDARINLAQLGEDGAAKAKEALSAIGEELSAKLHLHATGKHP